MDPRVARRPLPALPSEQEQNWLGRCRAGDASAFQPLVRPYLPGLLALARRHCSDSHWAEDLVQETLVRAFRALPGFRGEAALRTWLFRILVRLAADPRRWRRGSAEQSLGEIDVPDHLDAPAVHDAVARELQSRLAEAMERLTVRKRTALHLRAVEGMDYAAIAGVLACTAVAARMLVLEARRKIMERVREHLDP